MRMIDPGGGGGDSDDTDTESELSESETDAQDVGDGITSGEGDVADSAPEEEGSEPEPRRPPTSGDTGGGQPDSGGDGSFNDEPSGSFDDSPDENIGRAPSDTDESDTTPQKPELDTPDDARTLEGPRGEQAREIAASAAVENEYITDPSMVNVTFQPGTEGGQYQVRLRDEARDFVARRRAAEESDEFSFEDFTVEGDEVRVKENVLRRTAAEDIPGVEVQDIQTFEETDDGSLQPVITERGLQKFAAEQVAASSDDIDRQDIARVDVSGDGEATVEFTEGLQRETAIDDALSELRSDQRPAGEGLDPGDALGAVGENVTERDLDVSVEDEQVSVSLDEGFQRDILRERVAQQSDRLDASDITIEETDDGVVARPSDEVQQQVIEQQEQEIETAEATVPDWVPVVGGAEVSGQARDVEIEESQTSDGEDREYQVQEQERFGDFDFGDIPESFTYATMGGQEAEVDIPGGGGEFEDVTGALGEGLIERGEDAGDVLSREIIEERTLLPGAIVEEQLTGDTDITETLTRNVPAGAAALGDQALNLPQELAELGVHSADEISSGRGWELGEDLFGAGVAQGILVGQEAANNPAKVWGQLGGSSLAAGGGIAAATRLLGPRAGRVVSTTVQPGEELAIAAARRGAISQRAATLAPGVRNEHIQAFKAAERGQMDLTGPTRSEVDVDQETTTITGSDLSSTRATADPTRGGRFGSPPTGGKSNPDPGPSARGTSVTEPSPGGWRTARTEAATAKQVTPDRRYDTVPEWDLRTEIESEEGLPAGMRQRQREATRQEARVDDTLLAGDSALAGVLRATELNAGPLQRLQQAQSLEALQEAERLEDRVRQDTRSEPPGEARVDTGVETRAETRAEARQEFRQELRTELQQESRQETRQEPRREIRVEPRREFGSEFQAGFEEEPSDEEEEFVGTEEADELFKNAIKSVDEAQAGIDDLVDDLERDVDSLFE